MRLQINEAQQMKIFSIRSKKNLLVFSAALGFSFCGVAAGVSVRQAAYYDGGTVNYFFGWPFQWFVYHRVNLVITQTLINKTFINSYDLIGLFYNFLFWSFVAFVILSLARNFKNKKIIKT